MSSRIFRRFKSKGPEVKGQKLALEKSRGTDKTLKRHITVINVYSSISKMDALWYIDCTLEKDICDPTRHKYLNLPNLCNIILTG